VSIRLRVSHKLGCPCLSSTARHIGCCALAGRRPAECWDPIQTASGAGCCQHKHHLHLPPLRHPAALSSAHPARHACTQAGCTCKACQHTHAQKTQQHVSRVLLKTASALSTRDYSTRDYSICDYSTCAPAQPAGARLRRCSQQKQPLETQLSAKASPNSLRHQSML
jgi:hypothetical protein